MTIVEKLTNELKKLNSNLGLSQEMLNSVASAFVIGLNDESTDEQVLEMAGKALPMMKSLQSESDKIRTAARKAAEEKFKVDENQPIVDNPDMPAWFKQYADGQKAEKDNLLAEIEKLKGENTKKSFEAMVDRIGSDLCIKKDVLDLYRGGLSADMDETAVKNALGNVKKTLIAAGMHFEEKPAQSAATQRQQMEAEGNAYFAQLKAKAEAANK